MDFITMELYRKYILCVNRTPIQKNKWYDCILYKDLEPENKNNTINKINSNQDIKPNIGSTFK